MLLNSSTRFLISVELTMDKERMYNKAFGILIVGDECGNDGSENENCTKIKRAIADMKGHVCCKENVPNDENAIMNKLIDWSDNSKADVIVISEGTGFSETDIILNAMNRVNQKGPENDSAMLHLGVEVLPMRYLSRAACAIRGKTLIIYSSCSSSASANLILSMVAASLLYAEKKLAEAQKKSLEAREKLNDPTLKQKKLKETLSNIMKQEYEIDSLMVSVDKAKEVIADRVTLNKTEIEEISTENSFGRFLATAIQSNRDIPSYRASSCSGYAVIAADGIGSRTVLESEHSLEAGQEPCPIRLYSGECMYIESGASVPEGTTAVVKSDKLQDSNKFCETIDITRVPCINANIRKIGCDIKKGEIILSKETRIGAEEIGILVSCGIMKIPVFKLPSIGILSIGNELQEPGKEPKPNHVYEKNKIMLKTTFKDHGYDAFDFGIIKADAEAIVNSINDALNLINVLIIVATKSFTDKNILQPILKEVYGADIHFNGIDKALFTNRTTFATCSVNETNKYILCLPGYPDTAIESARSFAIPLVNGLSHHNINKM